MTYRERKEARLAKREEWAAARERDAAQHFKAADPSEAATGIPFGQPILVGHHSEGRHRRALARLDAHMSRACESTKMAERHLSVAAGISDQLDRSIYSDDHNATEALRERIAERETRRERMKQVNKLYRAKDADGLATLGLDLTRLISAVAHQSENGRLTWLTLPHPAYELTNLGALIRTDKKRLAEITVRQQRVAVADNAGGVAVEYFDGQTPREWCRVTFAEKPPREMLNALRAASFRWGAGSWTGRADALPPNLTPE